MEDARSDASQPTVGTYRSTSQQREGSIRSENGISNHGDPPYFESRQHFDKEMNVDCSPISPHASIPHPQQQQPFSSQPEFFLPFRRNRSSSVSSSVSSTSSVSTVGYESVTSGQENTGPVPTQTASSNESNDLSTAPHIARKPRGMWTSVVQGVQSNLGAMVISEDAVRALKYCLKILQEAARNIENQVDILRRYLAGYLQNLTQSITNDPAAANGPIDPNTTNPTTPPITPEPPANVHADLNTALSSVTREVVGTLKLVVEMLVKHASSRLPPPARRRVRDFILRLPSRWASLANDLNTPATPQNGVASAAAAAAIASGSSASTAATPASYSTAATATNANGNTESPYPTEAQRVLTLAAESSAMLKNVMNVMNQTVMGAEAVLGRTVEDDSSLPSIAGLRIGSGPTSPVGEAAVTKKSGLQPAQSGQGVQMELDLD